MGSMILLFIGCMSEVDGYEFYSPSPMTVAIAFGIALMIAVNCVAGISAGGHVTPIVTIAAVVNGLLSFPVNFILLIKKMKLISLHDLDRNRLCLRSVCGLIFGICFSSTFRSRRNVTESKWFLCLASKHRFRKSVWYWIYNFLHYRDVCLFNLASCK